TTGGPGPTPLTLTNDQVTSANKAVKVTVTRDGSDNVVTFVLPSNPPATPAGVQVFRSNSPYVLVTTLAAGSPGFTARSYRDSNCPVGRSTVGAVGEKPLRMRCPNCGREGILR